MAETPRQVNRPISKAYGKDSLFELKVKDLKSEHYEKVFHMFFCATRIAINCNVLRRDKIVNLLK